MTRINAQKGFTLVELAIVMTIIGLLIGGILKGQELMQNARVTSTVAQVKAYEAATTTFRDSYNAFPGDMPNAQNRIPNCVAACDPLPAGAGNSIVGVSDWASTNTWAAQVPAATPIDILATVQTAEGSEAGLYWMHLLQADLITGVTDSALRVSTTPAWGITNPSAKIGGGFVAGYGDGTPGLGFTAAGITGPAGTVLMMVTAPGVDPDETLTGQLPLSPSKAAQIDRKMDDGKPTAGYVQAWGVNAVAPADSCFDDTAADITYYEGNDSKSCGLIFRIQG